MRVESTLSGDQPVITNGKFEYQWTNHGSRLRGVVNHMFYSGSMVDVTVACCDGTVKAHQMILAAFSPYFQALFAANPCQHPVVFLHNVNLPLVKALIDFIYQGTVTCSVSDVPGILELARSLQIRGLDHLSCPTTSVPVSTAQLPTVFNYSSTAQETPVASPCHHSLPQMSGAMPGGATLQPIHCHHLPGGATLVHHHNMQEPNFSSVHVGPPAPLTLPAETTVRLVTPNSSSWSPIPPVHRESERPRSNHNQSVPSETATVYPAALMEAESYPDTSSSHVHNEEHVPLNLSPNREQKPLLPLTITPAAGNPGVDPRIMTPPVTCSPVPHSSSVSPSQSSPQELSPEAPSREDAVHEEQPVPTKVRKIVKKRKIAAPTRDTKVGLTSAGLKSVVKRKRGRPKSCNAEAVNFVCLEEEGKSRYNSMYNRKARELGLKSGWSLLEDRVRRTLRGNSKDRSKGIMEKSRMVLKFRIPENLVKLSEGGAYDFYIPESGVRGRINDPNFSATVTVLTLKGLVRQTQFALKEEQLNYIREGNMAAASCYGRRAVTESLQVLATLQRGGSMDELMPEKMGFPPIGKETEGFTITIAPSGQQSSPTSSNQQPPQGFTSRSKQACTNRVSSELTMGEGTKEGTAHHNHGDPQVH